MERTTLARSLVLTIALAVAGSSAAACRGASAPRASDKDASSSGGHAGLDGGHVSGGADTGAEPGGRAGWLVEPDAWQTVETIAGCTTRVARDPGAIWPGFSFNSCGTGCREARVMPGDEPSLAAVLGTATRVVGSDLVLSLSARILGERTTFVLGTFAFGEGRPLALVAEEGACFAQVAGRGSPFLFRLFPLQTDSQYKLAWLEMGATPPTLEWIASPLGSPLETFDFATGWGGISERTTILLAESPTSAILRNVYQSRGVLRVPSGIDGTAAWTDWVNGQGRIVTYDRQSGAVTAASGAWYPARLGISARRIAWLGATGDRAPDGTYASARLYSCARTASLAPCEVVEGPALPIVSSTGVLVLADDWVALTGCSATECNVYVVDQRDSSVHRLRRAHPNHGVEVIGVSAGELFVADYSPVTRGTPDFDGFVRYDLSALESFATRL